MKPHHWVQAPRFWGCTFILTSGPRKGEQCCKNAVIACLDRRHCDGLEGRCKDHVNPDEFEKA